MIISSSSKSTCPYPITNSLLGSMRGSLTQKFTGASQLQISLAFRVIYRNRQICNKYNNWHHWHKMVGRQVLKLCKFLQHLIKRFTHNRRVLTSSIHPLWCFGNLLVPNRNIRPRFTQYISFLCSASVWTFILEAVVLYIKNRCTCSEFSHEANTNNFHSAVKRTNHTLY